MTDPSHPALAAPSATASPALEVRPLHPAHVAAIRQGGRDAYGNPPERKVSDGLGTPCRNCLRDVPAGETLLVAAARPFAGTHPYAETGPVFLCARECASWSGAGLPPVLATSPHYLMRGYCRDERIVYGTGQIAPAGEIADRAAALLARGDIAFVDIRSAHNNCWQARIVAA